MHVPDGFLDAPTSIATGVVAAGAIGLAVRRASAELNERTIPLAGLTSAFVFATQMLNFPVGVGTSGHLMGGTLAAVLVGPWTAVLCMSVVFIVQALLFADGGLTALGTNITLMGLTTVLVGWLVTRGLLRVLPRRPQSVVPAAVVGAILSVVAASLLFVALYAVGGTADIPLGALAASMVGWHTLIGIGEGVITGLTVGAVVAVRPDLVHAARGLMPRLQLRDAAGNLVDAPVEETPAAAKPRGLRGPVIASCVVIALIAGVVSFFASSSPDGLEHVSAQEGFADTAKDHALGGWAFADYGEVGGIPVGIAGLLGVVAVLVLGWLVLRLARVARGRAEDRTADHADALAG